MKAKIRKRIWGFILAVLLTALTAVPALAEDEFPDLSKNGSCSISVTMISSKTQKPVSGGQLEVYQVADVHTDNGFVFRPLIDMPGLAGKMGENASLDASLAADIADYVNKKDVKGTTVAIGSDGKASLDGLNLGLYLVVQKKAGEGHNVVNPFLVSIPYAENGTYVYHVDATPKCGTVTPVNPPHNPPQPHKPPYHPTHRTGKTPERLPQTGQLWWPVWAMAAAGSILLAVGVGQKKNHSV